MPARPRLALLQLLLASTCCFFPRPSAAVEGVNVAWNHRFGQGTGVRNLAFACDTNEGVNVMTGSFISSIALSQIIGLEIVVDLASASASLAAVVGPLQRGRVPVVDGISGCPAATPTHRSKWGQLKALYR